MLVSLRQAPRLAIDASAVFEPYRLPKWLRAVFTKRPGPYDSISDWELVEDLFGRSGVFNWGKVALDGEDVLVYQQEQGERYALFESTYLANVGPFHPTWSFDSLPQS